MMSRRDAASSNTMAEPHSPRSRGRSRRKRRSTNSARRRIRDGFLVTFIKVGSWVMLLSSACYVVFLQQNLWAPRATVVQQQVDVLPQQKEVIIHNLPSTAATAFREEVAWTDAYGISKEYNLVSDNTEEKDENKQSFMNLADLLRFQFATLVAHGAELEARAVLQRSLSTVYPTATSKSYTIHGKPPGDTSPFELAYRIKQSNETAFSIAVMGSSAAAGAGNLVFQAYSFQLQKTLKEVFQSLNMELEVRNLAIEDTNNELPAIWCLDHYFPDGMPDLLIWDFGLSSTPESFEAFLRHVAVREDAPLLIFRESQTASNNQQRIQILQAYTDAQVLLDPLVLQLDQAIAPLRGLPRHDLPEGFQDWSTSWGVPLGAPGKEHTHLTIKQHSMVAWLISIHILSALELVSADQMKNGNILDGQPRRQMESLPPPVVVKKKKQERWTLDNNGLEWVEESTPLGLSLLAGEPKMQSTDSQGGEKYHFPQAVQCRTTYITAYNNDTMDSIVLKESISPLDLVSHRQDDKHLMEDLLLPKGAMFYNKGWVQSLDKATKRQKQLTKTHDFLGSKTIKKAYSGFAPSGNLNLFLPVTQSEIPPLAKELQATGRLLARDYIESVVLCESDILKFHATEAINELDLACHLRSHTFVYVGGEMAFLEEFPSDVSPSCVYFSVPEGASLSFRRDAVENLSRKHESIVSNGEDQQEEDNGDMIGLAMDIQVRGDKGNFKEPCSVAHVVWREVTDAT